jgi:threonine/homoserine/homoserine lactone efflux protein
MLGTHDLALFIVTALVLNARPGVDMLYTLTRTFQHGWRGGAAAALGTSSGCVVHTLATALGLAALLVVTDWAFVAVKGCGAAYLLWLAWGMLRAALRPGFAAAGPAVDRRNSASLARVFAQGFLTNVLNPKVALFFMALLPQFIRAEAADKPLAFLFLGAVFIVNGTLFLFALVAVAHRARQLQTRPAIRRALNGTAAALFAALAMQLATAQR